MTGFARKEGGDEGAAWAWEAKSVNGKALDLRLRLPSGWERLEPKVRQAVPKHCSRGNLQISLAIQSNGKPQQAQINQALLDDLIALAKDLEAKGVAAPAAADGLLAIRGVVEMTEEEESPEALEAREKALQKDLQGLLAALAEMRRAEGARLSEILRAQLENIERLAEEAAASAAVQPERLQANLVEQLDALLTELPALPQERIAQEAAVLITKADVREELDRLVAHIAAARELFANGGAIGRRLDFLCQELNREANTLCAKSPDVALTRIGLDLKAAIEQFREQIQNIE